MKNQLDIGSWHDKNFKYEWILLLVILVLLGAFIVFWHLDNYKSIKDGEKSRLTTQSTILKETIEHRLKIIHATHKNIIEELKESEQNLPFVTKRIKAMSDIFPIFYEIIVLDQNGNIKTSSKDFVKNSDQKNHELFKKIEAQKEELLYIGTPYPKSADQWAIDIASMLTDRQGNFTGVIITKLSANQIDRILGTVTYSKDMTSAIALEDGTLFAAMPKKSQPLGKNLRLKNSFFDMHIESKKPTTVNQGILHSTKKNSIIIQQTIKLNYLDMDKFFVIAVARDTSEILSTLRKQSILHLALYTLTFFATSLLLFIHQRKRRLFYIYVENTQKEILEKNSELGELNDQLEEQKKYLQSIAFIDGLTKIANRRNFDETLETHHLNAKRAKEPLSLIMLDVDFFKKYNDHYGHQQGDVCLQKVARVIAETFSRPLDLVARYGGEEFVCLLPNTSSSGAYKMAEKVRLEVEKLKLEHLDSSVAEFVTVSLGVATLEVGENYSKEELVSLADQALYEAKNSGRNRVFVAQNNKKEG